ncbi:MAG TPA: LEA type 2 family protein [Burkholderiaceae bacterium]|nr:LEA type 2 family protein [Burkholderiaceae bacterium]
MRVPRDARRPASRARRRAAGALAAALVSLGATSCGGVLPPADLKPPTVTFSDLAIESASLSQVRFVVTIATRNPNAVDIPLSNVRFGLSVLGQPVAQGTVPEQRFLLPAGGEREVPVALVVATSDLRAMLVRLALGSPADAFWELKGSAHWGASPFPIPFERRGDASSLRRLRELFRG